MKKNIFSLIVMITALLSLNFLLNGKPVIYLIGDSTCADKPLDDNQ